ncbi:hypothetical protein [Pelagicoccus mobilis]|uniref:Uncharacterized protein n=1 Tax=Pelagicoccus mobilis TaxID=415221 RepID=A0A934VSA8_9BACT|nr:hypothetical protein [Pelagicoccus mobilis]MBK1878314.1 hypothetical protein [Pelagicoccus mobilis]
MAESLRNKFAPYAFYVVLIASLLLLALESFQLMERMRSLTEMEGGFAYLERDEGSSTGFSGGTRQRIASDRNDDLHWVVNLQRAKEEGVARLREVDYDNAPEGRSVHWSSVYGWWIRVLAFDEPRSIEWAALAANVVLAAGLILVLSLYVRRVSGDGTGMAFCVGVLAMVPLRDVYKFGMGDHHAMAIFASMAGVLFFAMAVRRSVSGRSGLLEGALSAMALALAMWVNVVSVLPVLFGVGLALIVVRLVVGRGDEIASLVRSWAWMGALFSCLAHLIEYAPASMALRLEVNHPLYSLAWLGAGAFLAVLFESEVRKLFGRIALSVAMVIPLPVVFFSMGAEVFQVSDPFLMAVHDRFIMEFQTLSANLEVMTSPLRMFAMVLPLLILVVGGAGCYASRKRSEVFVLLACSMVPACILFFATLYQARWWSQLAGLLVVVLVCLFAGAASRSLRWLALGSLVPGALVFVYGAFERGAPVPRELTRVAERSVAHYLNARAGGENVVVLASPDATTNQIYYGGAKGIGTFYWENNEGLKRAASMFASPSMEVAKERILDAGVTHVLIYSWGGFEKEYLELHRDFAGTEEEGKSFLMRLMEDQEIPLWLRPIPFQLADRELGLALIYEVVPEMTPGELASRRFEYMLEMGLSRAAFGLEPLLYEHSKDSAAAISLCRLYALQKRKADLDAMLKALVRRLDGDYGSLSLGDAIRLSGVFGISGQRNAAKNLLLEVVDRLEMREVRKLNAETIRHFWDLADALDVDVDPKIRDQSMRLIPERLRRAN